MDTNRPFPSSPHPPFQSEAKCEVFVTKIRLNYHNKNFALRLTLEERLRGTQKWPIEFVIDDMIVHRWQCSVQQDTAMYSRPTQPEILLGLSFNG